MGKSSNLERAKRINSARAFINRHDTAAKAVSEMIDQYGISKRQAYRYIQEAKMIGKDVPIPDTKIAFTVKLSQNLIQALRQHAKDTGKTLSEIVTRSLEAFLQNGQRRG
jgi:predicted DNA-binding transcriptional regulator YafY